MTLSTQPVYPSPMVSEFSEGGHVRHQSEPGMTLLQHYAGLAMEGICVNAGRNGLQFKSPEVIAEYAVDIARALLAELEKVQP